MNHPARLIPLSLFCVGVGLPLSAHADMYGTATLDLSRIALKHANGTPFSAADFAHSTVGYWGRLYSVTGDTEESVIGTPAPQPSDLPLLCNGASCPITGENDFEPLSGTPAGLFAHADQMQSGGLLTGNLRTQQRIDAGARRLGSPSYAASDSFVQFQFRLSQPGAMIIELDATPFVTITMPQAGRLPGDSNDIGLNLSISLYNVTTNQWLFFDRSNEISYYSRLGFSGGGGSLENQSYDPGMLTISVPTGPLNSSDTYEVGISTSAFAWMTPVPEPPSFAMYCAGIVSLLLFWRRRRSAY